jgi:hypothetical protein
VWSTDIKTSVSGRERRRALWSYPIWKFKVGYDVLRDQAQYPAAPDIQRLIAFFNAHSGAYQEFLYNDRTDNTVTNQALGVGDGVKTSFQLTRTITVGGISATEPVFAVNGAHRHRRRGGDGCYRRRAQPGHVRQPAGGRRRPALVRLLLLRLPLQRRPTRH